MNFNICLLVLIAVSIKTVSAEGCPTGFLTHGSACYHFSHDTETWVGALQMCRELGSQLVEINDALENEFIKSTAKLLKTSFWIGLSDVREESTWVWMTSKNPLTSAAFSDWSPGQPNNSNLDENCATMYNGETTKWQWNDRACHTYLHYICEKITDIDIIG